MSKSNSDELDQQKNDHFQTLQDAESVLGQAPDRNLIIPELYEFALDNEIVISNHVAIELSKFIQSEISKREQLLLDELEEAVGNAKYGEDQGFNYEQAVDDVYDFINAKRGKK